MNLDQIQRTMFKAVRTPLAPGDNMRKIASDGASLVEAAKSIIKPNSRLTSFDRLELYNRQYWWRTISSLADDFDGLRAILGEKQFRKLVVAYLNDCPSTSFTLRNLGSKLEKWLSAHLEFVNGVEALALDMVKLEWAEVEAFDGESRPKVSAEDLAKLGEDPTLSLQPYIRLLELEHPVHTFLLRIRERTRNSDTIRRTSARYLPKRKKTCIAVHRLDDSVYFKEIEREAFPMLSAFQNGSTVSHAIESADWSAFTEDEVGAKIRDYFANWASLGWFCQAA